MTAANEKCSSIQKEFSDFKSKFATLETENDSHLNELQTLRETVQKQAENLIQSQKQESEALQLAASNESKLAPLNCDIDRLTKEKEIMKKHSEWLETQMNEKITSLRETRMECHAQTFEFETKVKLLEEENQACENHLANAKKNITKMEKALEMEREKIRELETKIIVTDDHFAKENAAQKRLAELYKESADEANAKAQELQATIQDLRLKVTNADIIRKQDISDLKTSTEKMLSEQSVLIEQKVTELENELKAAQLKVKEAEKKGIFRQQELNMIFELVPSAVEPMLISNQTTVKDMYDQVVHLEESLRQERADKKKMELYMTQIVREIQEKAPIIAGQKIDYQRAIESHDQLSERFDLTMQELNKSKQREKMLQKHNLEAQRDTSILNQQVADLSRQVQALLQKKQSTAPLLALTVSSEYPNSIANANDVITENLVVFHSVEELQTRNQQLLKVVRQLGQDKENLNGEGNPLSLTAKASKSPNNQQEDASLQEALVELEQMQKERERQEEMIAAIVHQRDMYRVLLAQADSRYVDQAPRIEQDPQSSSRAGAGDSSSSTADSIVNSNKSTNDHTSNDMLSTYRELQSEYEEYKKEKRTSELLFQNQLDKLREELTTAKLTGGQAEVDARFAREQYENLQGIKTALEEETFHYRSKNAEFQHLILQHQKTMKDLESRVMDLTSEVQQLKQEKQNLELEKKLVLDNEQRLTSLNSKLRTDQENQLKLMESISRIESGMDERNIKAREQIESQCLDLQAKVNTLTQQLQEQSEQNHASKDKSSKEKSEWTAELSQLQQDLVCVKEKEHSLRQQLALSTANASNLQSQVEQMNVQLSKGVSTAAAERVNKLELEIKALKIELQEAVVARKELQQNCEQYQNIASSNENALKELSNASEDWKSKQLEQMNISKEKELKYQEELDQKEQKMKALEQEKLSILDTLTKVQTAYDKSKQEQELAQERTSQHSAQLDQLRKEVSDQQQAFQHAQQNYEREIQNHALQLKVSESLKNEISEKVAEVARLSAELSQTVAQREQAETSLKEKNRQLDQQLVEMKEQASSLTEQNQLLHSQLNHLTTQLQSKVESVSSAGMDETTTATNAEDESANEKMLELHSLIRFLRRDKSILEEKYELATEEKNHHATLVASLQKSNDTLRKDLQKELQTSEMYIKTQQEQQKVLEKVQQNSLLRESNQMLRQELEMNSAKLENIVKELNTCKDEMEPIRKREQTLIMEKKNHDLAVDSLKEENQRWKARVDQLVEKYHQIDPEEHQKRVAEIEVLQKEKLEAEQSLEKMTNEWKQKCNYSERTLEMAQNKYDSLKKFAKDWKDKATAVEKQFNDSEVRYAALIVEKNKVQAAAATSSTTANTANEEELKMTIREQKLKLTLWQSKEKESNVKLQALQTKLSDETKKSSGLNERLSTMKEIQSKIESVLQKVRAENVELKKNQLDAVQPSVTPTKEATTVAMNAAAGASKTESLEKLNVVSSTVSPIVTPATVPTSVPVVVPSPTTTTTAPSPVAQEKMEPKVPSAVAPVAVVHEQEKVPATTTATPATIPATQKAEATGASMPVEAAHGSPARPLKRVRPGTPGTFASTVGDMQMKASPQPPSTALTTVKDSTNLTTIHSGKVPVIEEAAAAAAVAPAKEEPAEALAKELSAEEKLRQFALKSMMKKKMLPPPAAAAPVPSSTSGLAKGEKTGDDTTAVEQKASLNPQAKPFTLSKGIVGGFGSGNNSTTSSTVGGFGSSTVPFGSAAGLAGFGQHRPPLFGSSTPTGSTTGAAVKTNATPASPFLNLNPPSKNSSSSGLVFGKPGLSIPVPSSPSILSPNAFASAVLDTSETGGGSSQALPSPAATAATEEQKRQERLARFASSGKRPSELSEDESVDEGPAKKIKKSSEASTEEGKTEGTSVSTEAEEPAVVTLTVTTEDSTSSIAAEETNATGEGSPPATQEEQPQE